MNLSARLAEKLSLLLAPDERVVVLGDLAEASETGLRAVWEVLTLVARRLSEPWAENWRPWAATGMLLGFVALPLSWMSLLIGQLPTRQIVTYWQYGVRYESGLATYDEALLFLCHGLALMAWSWAGGFVVGSMARSTVWVTGALYVVLCAWPLWASMTFLLWWRGPSHRVPLVVLMLGARIALHLFLVGLPTVIGIRHAVRRQGTLAMPQAVRLALAVFTLTALAVWVSGWPDAAVTRWAGGPWRPSAGWVGRSLCFAVFCWPTGYIVGRSMMESRRRLRFISGEVR